MKKLILGILAAGMLSSAQAQHFHGGGGGWGHGGWGYGGGFGLGLASGVLVGAAVTAPWYYDGYSRPYYSYGPYYGYSYYTPSYYYSDPQPVRTVAPAPASAPAAQTQPTTIINNYNYYNSGPMSGANSLFGR